MYLKFTEPQENSSTPPTFSDSLDFFVAQQTLERGVDVNEVSNLLSELPTNLEYFNPLEHWQFRHIFSYESNYPFVFSKKSNCLFGRSGVCLYESIKRGTTETHFSTFDGYEIWLLDNMKLVTVSYTQIHIQGEQGTFISTYRSPCNLNQFEFDLEHFLGCELYDLLADTFFEEIDDDFPLEE